MRMYFFNKDTSCVSLLTNSLKLDSVACFSESLWDFSEQLFPWTLVSFKITAWCSPVIADESQKAKISWWKWFLNQFFGCSYYGFCTCHFCFGSYSKYLLIMLYVKLMTQTRVWEWNSVILFLRKSTWFFSRKAKIKIDDD